MELVTDGCGRDPLVDAISAFLTRMQVQNPARLRPLLTRTIDEAGPDAIAHLTSHLAEAGSDWNYYPHNPLARRIHQVLADPVMGQPPVVTGASHAAAVAGRPVVLFSNHLSYSDANVIDLLLRRAGCEELADRLTVVAGPKVYSDVRRRFSSLALSTIKVPQSSGVSSGDAVMTTREVAHAAKQSIEAATARLRQGDALLVFPEGTRSRDGAMQPLLSGVTRYLRVPGTWVLPVALSGSEHLYPVGERALTPAPIRLAIGEPIVASELHASARDGRQAAIDRVGHAIAALLPPEYRGFYAR